MAIAYIWLKLALRADRGPPALPTRKSTTVPQGWCFGRFELRPSQRLLLQDGTPVPLGARAFDLLVALVDHGQGVLSKRALMDAVWPGLVVEENNLSVQISTLRKLLGARAIATVPSVGYQFTMEREAIDMAPAGDATAGLDRQVNEADTRVWLCIKGPEAPAAGWPAAAAELAAHQPEMLAGPRLLACLPDARMAADCAHRLHALLRAHAAPGEQLPGIGMHAVADVGTGDPAQARTLACGLADRAAPGNSLVSASLAGRLVLSLDGDLQDLGNQHLPMVSAPVHTYLLQAPTAAAPEPVAERPAVELRPALAVLPLSDHGQERGTIRFGDILADQLISILSTGESLQVISRLSTAALKDRALTLLQIGRCLAADYVVSGHYWRADGQVRLSVELAEVRSSRVVWTMQCQDTELAVLQADSDLLQGLATGITQAMFLHELRSVRTQPLPTLANHTLLLAAIGLLYRLTPADFDLAHEALSLLHERAPRHAAPLAWLARWHLFRVVQGWTVDREADGQRALACAQRALDLDPDSSLALTMLAAVHTGFLHDLGSAEALCARALALNPNESLAWLQKGNAASFQGDGPRALAHIRHAVSLSPLDPARHVYQGLLASAALTAGDYDQAIAAARRSLQLNAAHLSSHRVLAIALALSGRIDEARERVRQIRQLDPTLTVASYQARSPGAASGLLQRFGQALLDAGLPAGSPP